MSNSKKCAVFVLLGQSNAVGHGIPMTEGDRIIMPMKNVFGLSRAENQSLELEKLRWSGYTSGGMNLAEEQDHTYSIANCLAAAWQAHIDGGNALGLPDLYIIHIAIGAQGVTRKYLWHPETEPILVPGVLGTVKISLFPFATRVFSLLDGSFSEMGREYEVIGVHWRGGENDVLAPTETLAEELKSIYTTIFDAFDKHLHAPPTILHRLVCPDRMHDMDPTGEQECLKKMGIVNAEFDRLAATRENFSVFDATTAPQFVPNTCGNGLFMQDNVHFTPAVNTWIAEKILTEYAASKN